MKYYEGKVLYDQLNLLDLDIASRLIGERVPKIILNNNIIEVHERGRPHKTQLECLQEDLKNMKIT
jgi:hypothetical protein